MALVRSIWARLIVLSWLGTAPLMMKTQFVLGILSIPEVLDTLGMIDPRRHLLIRFKLRHPEVYGIDDAGELMFGRARGKVFGVAFCIYWVFCSESGMPSTSIGLGVVSFYGASTTVFVEVAAIVSFGLASIRTLGQINRHSLKQSLRFGCVIYFYCGSYVTSPALGSARVLIKNTIVVLQFPSKYIFVRILRGSAHLTANSVTHWTTWLCFTLSVTVFLIGARLGTLMSFQPMGCMWLYDNWSGGRNRPTFRWVLLVV
ncbi:hypothetical protein BJX96DRAFT_164248 [Aspergillus floccosus]